MKPTLFQSLTHSLNKFMGLNKLTFFNGLNPYNLTGSTTKTGRGNNEDQTWQNDPKTIVTLFVKVFKKDILCFFVIKESKRIHGRKIMGMV